MDIAYCSAFSKALSATQQKTVMNYANTFKEPHTAATIFTVTVSGGVYWISTNGAAAVSKPSLTLAVGNVYVFDQSHSSNVGYPLRLSTTGSSPSYNVGVVINGTPGSLNAYTLIDITATTTLPLYYYSTTTANMGPVPVLPLIWYQFEVQNNNVIANSGTAGTAGDATIVPNGANTISYNTVSTYVKKGTMSLYNSVLATYNSSSYVILPNVLLTGNGFTFCVWMYLLNYNTISSVHHIIFRFKYVPNNIGDLDVIIKGELTPPAVIMNFSSPISFGTAAGMKTSWQHIAFTMNKTTKLVNVYTNGQYQNNFTTTVAFPSNTSEFQFIHDGPNSAYTSLYGYVDDYRIYDSELTAADISSIYNS
jgi:hypothetical protein